MINYYSKQKRRIELIQHYSYFPYMRNLLLFIFVLVFIGCPSKDTPEQLWFCETQFEFLQSTQELYFEVYAASTFQGSSLSGVDILWYCTSLDNEPDTISLNDSGQFGDILPGDGHFAVKVSNDSTVLKNSITPSTIGTVYLDVITQYGTLQNLNNESYQLGNIRPSILSVSFPDTLPRPSQPQTYVVDTIKVMVHDANGLNDLQSCFLLFQKPDSTWANNGNPISLYDDGVKNQQMFLWDDYSSDGIYSRLITIGSDNPLGTYRAEFYVKDQSGEYGEVVVKTLEVVE